MLGDVAAIPSARRWIGRVCSGNGLSEAAVERLTIAAHEIIANAILHGGGEARVGVEIGDRHVVVTIADSGSRWNGTAPSQRPDAGQLGGRGLWLAANLCDDLTIGHGPAGTTVRLVMNRTR
jgi:anti-sigma regulatory factor (Ser/Thr protein kinase)